MKRKNTIEFPIISLMYQPFANSIKLINKGNKEHSTARTKLCFGNLKIQQTYHNNQQQYENCNGTNYSDVLNSTVNN